MISRRYNSYLLEQKSPSSAVCRKARRVDLFGVRKRAAILEKLHKRGGYDNFDKLFEVIAEAYKQGLI